MLARATLLLGDVNTTRMLVRESHRILARYPDAGVLPERLREVERMTIEAARTGSRELAVKALALHPLVPSVNTARRIFDAYAGKQRELAALFS